MECTKIIFSDSKAIKTGGVFRRHTIFTSHFSHGTNFEFVPRGHKVLQLGKGQGGTQMSTWLVFILYK